MWVIGEIDYEIFAVPISWVINNYGQIKCFWPLQDERKKRATNEIPPPFGTDGWELFDCVILLNGAIYEDFEDALAIEIDGIDFDDKSANERPKLSWNNKENEFDDIITENTETDKQSETSVIIENLLYSEFERFSNRPDLCSTINEFDNQHNLEKGVDDISTSENYASKFVKSNIREKIVLSTDQAQSDTEMLDTILKNQKEKKKILVKLMTRMYSLES